MEITPKRSIARTVLPWLVAAVMLILYFVTLSKTVTVESVYPLARATGADWHPTYIQPLYWLVTLPVRLLPAGAQLLALNFVSALCAALSLALLARCVAILPHDRTQLQRDKLPSEDSFLPLRLAWVPVGFAVLVCGLQRSFWENAIVNTGEALDLLLFAYCVRCLLEFRVDERNSWLNKLAVVYGLAIANNFAMIAFFPVLVGAVFWIKGLRFFRFDFLARMFLLGLAGLSLYLLLPLVQMQSDIQPMTFWQALKTNLVFQKHALMDYRRVVFLPAIYALLPLILMGIRWPSSFGDQSPVGGLFANAAGVILHLGLLVFCTYIAFDPPLGPREVGAPYRAAGAHFVFLPCYFLGALSIGYLTGFLLLIFSAGEGRGRRRAAAIPPPVNYAVTAIVCAGALFVAGKLFAQNYPFIRQSTSSALYDYAQALARSLPDKPAVILSDDPGRLHAVAAVLGRAAVDKHLLLDAPALSNPSYQTFLRQRYGERWPKLNLEKGYIAFPMEQIVGTLLDLNQKHELIYLHPSFGSYFETFYLEPRGLAYALKRYAADSDAAPVPDAALIDGQNAVWNALATGPWKELKATLDTLPADPMKRSAHGSTYVGSCYSRALNWWGVELQRADRFDEAARFFDEALALNSDNASAFINQEANALWRKEKKLLPAFSRAAEEKLKLYRGAENLFNLCGPIDVPDFSMEFAQIFVRGRLYRQAGQMVRRAQAYVPENPLYEAALANIEVMSGRPARALLIIQRVRPRTANATPLLQIEIERIAALAQYGLTNFPAAEKLLKNNLQKFPNEDASYNALSQLYVTHSMRLRETNDPTAGQYLTNALKVIEGHVTTQPQNPSAHFNYGHLQILVGDYAAAANEYTRVLDLQKENSAALLSRAMAYLQDKKFDEAKRDYQTLLGRYTTTDYRVYYGLGEIAYQQQDWSAAREYYTQYLRYAPANSGEAQTIRIKLDEVKKKD